MRVKPDFRGMDRRKLIWMGVAVVAVLFFATLPAYYDVANKQLGIFFFMVFLYGGRPRAGT